ncbi:MAG: tyrosine-type recombinase/integrase [Spirochaetota bacterium]
MNKILSKEQIEKILQNIHNLKYRTMISLVYGSGMKLSEILKLTVNDIDIENLTIHIKGENGKDRFSIFPKRLVNDLNSFISKRKTNDLLFPADSNYSLSNNKAKLTQQGVRAAFRKAREQAGIAGEFSVNSLRKSFAVHMLENGVSTNVVQELLGFENSDSMQLYQKLAKKGMRKLQSPF